jgi:hypothetical protein
MCATLAIPIPHSRTAVDALVELDDNTVEKQRRLATLLGLSGHPTRANLVKDLVSGVIYIYTMETDIYKHTH